mgnify:CR=1 FL=1
MGGVGVGGKANTASSTHLGYKTQVLQVLRSKAVARERVCLRASGHKRKDFWPISIL